MTTPPWFTGLLLVHGNHPEMLLNGGVARMQRSPFAPLHSFVVPVSREVDYRIAWAFFEVQKAEAE